MSELLLIGGLAALYLWQRSRQETVSAPGQRSRQETVSAPVKFTQAYGLKGSPTGARVWGGTVTGKVAGEATREHGIVTTGPKPDLLAFKDRLQFRKAGEQAIGVTTRPGDLAVIIMDMSPEGGRGTPIPGVYGTAGNYDAYVIVASKYEPRNAFFITDYSVQKAAGGEDEVYYTMPDGTPGHRKRKRGDQWPSGWSGDLFYLRWKDHVGTAMETIGSIAESVAGEPRPFLVCRASTRYRNRKMVELLRAAKMHKRFRDVGEKYWIPTVITIFDWVGSVMNSTSTGLPVKAATAMNDLMMRVMNAAASGSLTGWRSFCGLMARSMTSPEMLNFVSGVRGTLPTKAVEAIDKSIAAIRTANALTKATAAMLGVKLGAIEVYNIRAANAGSPSRVAQVLVYE